MPLVITSVPDIGNLSLSDHVCLWNGSDRIRRQKLPLVSPIQVRLPSLLLLLD